MNGGDNTTPPEPRPMTQEAPVNSSLRPLNPSPSSVLHHPLGPVSLSPSTTLNVNRRTQGESIETLSGHYKSISMDTGLNDFLNIPVSSGYISSTSLVDGDDNTFDLGFAEDVYTANELEKISKCPKLSKIQNDPKKVRRFA
ncbi:uncharacterized protein LOC17892404 [Capsella rubella]|uniref:uncharacterized protein LOC17892404 n=1 Tax=Capsella rubella TaxID=81985 RepID=UPI000CD4FD61|nr:uncharacterized protein LOC17892404 [Capsella rubella]